MPSRATLISRATKSRTIPAESLPPVPHPTEEQIRRRAYELYLQRGLSGGSPEGDWLQAEQELRSRMILLGR